MKGATNMIAWWITQMRINRWWKEFDEWAEQENDRAYQLYVTGVITYKGYLKTLEHIDRQAQVAATITSSSWW
jgi:hypothetical protein